MEAVEAEKHRLLQASLARSTHATYNSCISRYVSFVESYNLDSAWPASHASISSYIAFLSLEGYAPASVSTHMAAIAFVHKVNMWSDPTNSFLIKKLMEGFRRQNRRVDKRLPITHGLLCRIVEILPSICKSSYEGALFRAAFLVAFFGFLRVGEFASVSKSADTSRILAITDVAFRDGGLELIIRFSKTDQRGRAVTLFLQRAANSRFCPVVALLDFMRVRVNMPGSLFAHFDMTPLTISQFSRILKRAISVAGLDPANYSAHSIRIGAATSAFMCGLSDAEIQALGRWKSAAFKLYIRPGNLHSTF